MKHGNMTHGKCGTPIYWAWSHMLNRCRNKNDAAFKNYGGRGIKVCKRWYKFTNFLKDMGKSSKGLTLERVNNNSGYKPSNCKWIPKSEQGKNTRRVRRLTLNGKTHSVAEWSRITGIKQTTISARLSIRKLSLAEALSVN